MKKSNLLAAVAAICLMATSLHAQTVVYDKYFVGADLHWIWGKYSSDPSLSFKIIDSKRKASGNFSARKGWRFRLNADYNKLSGLEQVIPDTRFPTHLANLGLNLGYEWHKGYKRFDFFYGFDVVVSARAQDQDIYYYFNPNNAGGLDRYAYWSRRKAVGIGPVAGLSIQIIEGLHIMLESAWYSAFYQDKYFTFYNEHPVETTLSNGFSTRFSPISTLNVMFSFR